MSSGMNGTITRGVFDSIEEMQSAGLRVGVRVDVYGGDTYDIYATNQGASIPLDNGLWAEVVVSNGITPSELTTAQNDIVGGSIFKGSNGETVENGDIVEPGITHLRISVGGTPKILAINPLASGVISALTDSGATIGTTPVIFSTTPFVSSFYQIYAFNHIADYANPTIDELNYLMSCGKVVIFSPGEATYPDTNINLQGNTIWKVEVPGTYTVNVTSKTDAFHTSNNVGVCGFIGFKAKGGNNPETVFQYTNCNVVYCEENYASDNNPDAPNYNGAFIYLNVNRLIQGGNEAENIKQTPGVSVGEYQSFSYNNVGIVEWNGKPNRATNCNKLWHCDGVSSGETGLHVGKNIDDNICYVLGTPQKLIAEFIGENYQEGIVFNASGDSDFHVPYCSLTNGSSRVVALRSGSGLTVGTLKSRGSRSGIADDGYDGTKNVHIDYADIQGVEVERAISLNQSDTLLGSELDITSLRLRDVDGQDSSPGAGDGLNEVIRVSGSCKFTCEYIDDEGGVAPTFMRLNELTTGYVKTPDIKTDKTPIVYQASTNFGGKVGIRKINEFEVEGNSPDTIFISAGILSVTNGYHRVDTEGGASSDEIDTISGNFPIGAVLTLQSASNVRDPILKHNTGNIWLPNATDIRLNATYDRIRLRWDGSYWSPSL